GRNKMRVAFNRDFVNSDDVRVIECGSSLRFLLETLQAIAVIHNFSRKNFERYFAIEPHVLSQINLAHSTRPDLAGNAVTRDCSVSSQLFARCGRSARSRQRLIDFYVSASESNSFRHESTRS